MIKLSSRTRGFSPLRAKHFGLHIGGANLAATQALDRQAVTRRYPVAPMPPTGDQGHRNPQLFGELGGAVGINEGCKSVHDSKFNQAKPKAQAQSLAKLDHVRLDLEHTKRMNIPWYVKARERVDALGMQRQQFAERMGVTKGLVTQWFQGRTTPPIKRFPKMAEVLDMTVAELIADDETFAKTITELSALRMIRELPEEQHDAALELFATLIRGIKSITPPPTHTPA